MATDSLAYEAAAAAVIFALTERSRADGDVVAAAGAASQNFEGQDRSNGWASMSAIVTDTLTASNMSSDEENKKKNNFNV